MSIIPHTLFGWEEEFHDIGDLKRLQIVLDTLPDEALMQKLERERGNGRNDFPVRAEWNLVIAGIIYGHNSMASLLRELNRNKQLVHICGFGFHKLPQAHNMSRFVRLLIKHESAIKEMFIELSKRLYTSLDNFGKELAIDSKWLHSAANRTSKHKNADGRSETDARIGVKKYSGIREDGSVWDKVVRCFGFKIHLLVDATYELPVDYVITDAAASDITVGKKLVKNLKRNRPEVLDKCQHLMADRGYDDTPLIEMLKERSIKAVIDKRILWSAQSEKEVPGYPDAYYTEDGNVYCYSPDKGQRRLMAQNGYEKERDAVRFKCPAKAYGLSCSGVSECRCKSIRIPLSTDPRIFTQVQRESYQWKRLYRMRTAVERVNSRLDVAYGFEERRTRGLARTNVHMGMALLVMMAMAVWRVQNQQKDKIRSLLEAV